MKEHLNSYDAPINFMLCANHTCNKQSNCLRYRVLQSGKQTVISVNILNPNMYVSKSKDCSYFKEAEMYSYALGITHLFDALPYAKAKELRARMINHFGKSMFYRFLRKEKHINPEQQQWIKQLFKKHSIVDEMHYDEYKQQYNWD